MLKFGSSVNTVGVELIQLNSPIDTKLKLAKALGANS